MSLDKRTYEAFKEIIYEKAGIALGENKEALISARVGKRLRALKMETYKQYLQFLTSNTPEAENEFIDFLNVVSTNTTSFFREPAHFDLMARLVQDMVAEGRNKIRIWCAASSSGEEPYTIVMTFLENSKGFRGDFKLLATDISMKVLKEAVEGKYTEQKMEGVPPKLRMAYFTAGGSPGAKVFTANNQMKSMISFNRLNLAKPPFPMKGPFDIIFCRNVMIYFDNVVRKNLIQEFERLLRPEGHLIVAHSESIAGLTSLKSVKPSVWIKR